VLVVGERIGSYRVEARLGEGGMGLVFAAVHETIGKRAAIKVLRAELSENAEVMRRFFNEARATSQVRHPGLVDVYDFGQLPSGSAYIVMELLEGETLYSRLRRQPCLGEPLAVALGSQLAAALGAAHLRGVIHRDLKPDNIFLVDDAALPCRLRAKVLDFGVAKLEDALRTTIAGTIIGTPKYMAPEQCRGDIALDHRADIYSLGCILFEMLCGRPPFIGHGSGEVIAAQLFQEPPSLRGLAPAVSPAMEEVVRRCLAKRVDQRFASMIEVGVALAALQDESQARAEKATLVDQLPPPARDKRITTLSSGVKVVGNARTTRVRNAGLSAVGLLALATVAGIVTARHVSSAPSPSSSPPSPPPPVPVAVTAPAPAPAPAVEHAPAPTWQQHLVRLDIDSTPSSAEVFAADGTRVGTTPFSIDRPRSAERLVYTMRKKGYRPYELSLAPSMDQTVRARLVRERTAPRPSTTSDAPDDDAPALNDLKDPFGN
jgi:serine/threonine protein kinase